MRRPRVRAALQQEQHHIAQQLTDDEHLAARQASNVIE
jgi:hypothetical protein